MKIFFTIINIFLTLSCFSQESVSGKIITEDNEPLAGASVFISNTTVGTVSDSKGEFTLVKLPAGNVKLTATFIGYEPATVIVSAARRNEQYIIILHPRPKELKEISLGLQFEKEGWQKWGETFTTAFVGASLNAPQCVIKNKEVIKFIYDNKMLHAYASEPLVIENRALGYMIYITLVGFVCDVNTGNVDYQVYSLFKEMEGSDDDVLQWKKNRAKTYSLSLMHFTRALYSQNFKNEGYEIRALENKINPEKERIKNIYSQRFTQLKDSLSKSGTKDDEINKMIEKTFSRDSVKYYKKVLSQDDRTIKLHDKLLNFKDIASVTDSNTILLHFKDYIQVVYKKMAEPEEYYNYKLEQLKSLINAYNKDDYVRAYPVTELTLLQSIPIEINEQGYFNNVDLFMNGFWGWWEKMATKLPYQYEP